MYTNINEKPWQRLLKINTRVTSSLDLYGLITENTKSLHESWYSETLMTGRDEPVTVRGHKTKTIPSQCYKGKFFVGVLSRWYRGTFTAVTGSTAALKDGSPGAMGCIIFRWNIHWITCNIQLLNSLKLAVIFTKLAVIASSYILQKVSNNIHWISCIIQL